MYECTEVLWITSCLCYDRGWEAPVKKPVINTSIVFVHIKLDCDPEWKCDDFNEFGRVTGTTKMTSQSQTSTCSTNTTKQTTVRPQADLGPEIPPSSNSNQNNRGKIMRQYWRKALILWLKNNRNHPFTCLERCKWAEGCLLSALGWPRSGGRGANPEGWTGTWVVTSLASNKRAYWMISRRKATVQSQHWMLSSRNNKNRPLTS